MNETPISWTAGADGRPGSTWNPTDGCEVCSPGCKNCYAMRMAGRFSGPGKPYEGLVTFGKNGKAVWNGVGLLNIKALHRPLHWKRPRKVFVDSMSDLFFEPINDVEIAATFGVMALAPQHTYLVLTKRGARMNRWYHDVANSTRPAEYCVLESMRKLDTKPYLRAVHQLADEELTRNTWPLPNVWQGVSVDTRKHGLPRIDELRDIDAAVRWLSIEPLLEDLGELDLRGIHWVVLGCESGPGSRECKVEWIRSIIEQCKAAGIPVFVKQLEHTPGKFISATTLEVGADVGSHTKGPGPCGGRIVELPYLDGVQYAQFPKEAHHGHV